MSDGGTGYGLLLAFDTDDQEFARGVEIGMRFTELDRDGFLDHVCMQEANAEMVMRMAEARGLPFRAEALAPGWLTVTIGRDAITRGSQDG